MKGQSLIESGGFVLYTLLYKSDAVVALKVEEQKAKSGDLEAGQACFCSFATVQLCELGQCA